jgi:superfamily II DNA or RNA helicase
LPIPTSVAASFSASVRARGEDYYRRGCVQIVHADASSIRATVRGTMSYSVEILADSGGLDIVCTCPFALEYGVCKHAWATLLALDATDRLPGIPDERNGNGGVQPVAPITVRTRELALPSAGPASSVASVTTRSVQGLPPRTWKQQVRALAPVIATHAGEPNAEQAVFPEDRRLVYIVDIAGTFGRQDGLVVELATETRQKDGEWGSPKQFRLTRAQWLNSPDIADREIAQMLLGAQPEYGYYAPGSTSRRFILSPAAFGTTLKRMCDTGRAGVRIAGDKSGVLDLGWDDGPPWELRLSVAAPDAESPYRLSGHLERGDERLPLDEPLLFMRGGLLIARGAAGFWLDHGAFDLVPALRTYLTLEVPRDEVMDFVAELHALPRLPPLDLPAELQIQVVDARPVPHLSMRPSAPATWSSATFDGTMSFDYSGEVIAPDSPTAAMFHADTRRIIRRNREAEAEFAHRLTSAGFRREYDYSRSRHVLRLPTTRAARVALELTTEGWRVEREGRVLRPAGAMTLDVRSGIDWFDLEASLDFGGVRAGLPELLTALKRGERTVTLSDGSLGMLTDEWLDRAGLLATAGTLTHGRLRFAKRQLGVLDVLLSTLPAADTDAAFRHARDELQRFEGITPRDAPDGFVGTLRPYQRDGLGWMDFLRQFGFGGCLADDMGLGKTVQVLALLESRRVERAGPSLVVVPRSLVFNWEQEAARFTPQLRVLVHGGPDRRRTTERLHEYDVVITTYGLLRRDVHELREFEFDYVILDEAQAIKNARTEAAKAARLLRARNRLAMSGTPIENRLTELWSLLEFLNPGMLGSASRFGKLLKQGGAEIAGQPADPEPSRELLARVVRPYILRRTKGQVAPELPERLEQTLIVDLSTVERKLYDELRDHYRGALLGRIASEGLKKSKLHILEALLRLRQAACHPGLVDPERRGESSSKVDVLLSRVAEAVAEDHKVLVFSQFTSLLSIVRSQLDAGGMTYEYLDGRTKDRQGRVEAFQNDPSCKIFLVSLKAGGLGLNLTAAEYVYLLDPWWNPAVEAQAIDRAHRIGQTRRVFASRLIARDTVEEKVLELQRSKRDLADAIIRADDSVVASLRPEDLELLLS